MIKPIKRKKNINNAVAVQNLVFEQGLYSENSDKQSKLVNQIYNIQHWHYFYSDDNLDFKGKIQYLNNLFGKYSIKKKLPEKGMTYLWFVEINGTVYTYNISMFICLLY